MEPTNCGLDDEFPFNYIGDFRFNVNYQGVIHTQINLVWNRLTPSGVFDEGELISL